MTTAIVVDTKNPLAILVVNLTYSKPSSSISSAKILNVLFAKNIFKDF